MVLLSLFADGRVRRILKDIFSNVSYSLSRTLTRQVLAKQRRQTRNRGMLADTDILTCSACNLSIYILRKASIKFQLFRCMKKFRPTSTSDVLHSVNLGFRGIGSCGAAKRVCPLSHGDPRKKGEYFPLKTQAATHK